MRIAFLVFALLISSSQLCMAGEPEPLFNGKDLTGWVQRGGDAKYEVQDDSIVGVAVPRTPNSFLCTKKDYGDFILEMDFKIDDGLNSGVQIRSECFDERTTTKIKLKNGKVIEKTYPAGLVHGYQVEINADGGGLVGAIYDEARRGWLDNLAGEGKREAREAFKQGEWNHYRIVAKGSRMQVFLNGVAAADIDDDVTPRGFIGLQVHSIGNSDKAGKTVRWRNITIQEISADDAS